MKNSFGNSLITTIFGESHGEQIGAVLDGLAPGLKVDREFINSQLDKRRPSGRISTARQEADQYSIVSGVFNDRTTGTPLCITIPNTSQHSKDYSQMRSIARPGHADYTAYCKYHGYEDYRGGGHFSGRITAAVVAAGAIVIQALEEKGITIGTHIYSCGPVKDRDVCNVKDDIKYLNGIHFPVLDESKEAEMTQFITAAAEQGDSVGGVLETYIDGMPAGVGEPWFDSLESILAHGLYAVPAIKGVQFGAGFDMTDCYGSQYNDSLRMENGRVVTVTNNNGGINGGISNGMPIRIRCAVKPTPSIFKKQETIDFLKKENTDLEIQGRHDPAIIHRARVVVDSVVALVIYDALAARFGTDFFGGENN